MQKINKTILITIVLVSLLCLTAVSAASDDAVIAGDSASSDDIIAAESDIVVAASEDAQTVENTNAYDDASYEADDAIANSSGDTSNGALGSSLLGDANTKTFSQLADDIASNPAMLSGAYYKYDANTDSAYSGGITLTNGLTIIGGGATIDGNNLARIFNIPEGVSVTLMNLNLINGAADEGAAIYNSGKLTLMSSKVNDNTAVKSGAGIYNNKGEVLVTSCEFDGNDLTDRTVNGWGGAAIYSNEGAVTITDTNVTNNLKNIVHRGGTGAYTGDLSSAAVTSEKGSLTVTNSYFANNSGSYGGAILANGAGTLLVSGTTFENNFAFNGGAIDIAGTDYTITDSKFYNNDAKGTGSSQTNYANGGAICAQDADNQALISGCIFEGNTAAIGGAISTTNTVVTDSTFTNNNAYSANSETFNNKTNNRGGFGGAIYNDGTITIDDSTFTDNIGRGRGLDLKNAEISDSSFSNTIINVNNRGTVEVSNNHYDNDGKDISSTSGCTVAVNVEDGDVPYVTSGTILFNGDMTFQDLQDIIDAGNTAITLGGNVVKADDEVETFANGISITNSVTIYGNEKTISASTGKIFNVAEGKTLSLNGNTLAGSGETAITNYGTVSLGLANPNTFTNCGETPIDNQGRTSQTGLTTFTQLSNLIALVNGGELYIGSSKITKADGEDEITITKDIAITGYASSGKISTYINANNDGRVFTVAEGKTLTLANINITNGAAEKGAGVYVSEGATLNANNVNFLNNVAVKRGGAIYSEGTVNIDTAIFDSNDITFRTANDDNGGAAIYNLNGVLNVNNANITNNLKDIVIRNGNAGDLLVGVIVTSGETTITDSYFANNTGSWGGAISSLGYMNENPYTLTVTGTTFEGNNATFGGAIFVESSNLVVDDCTFTENSGVGVGSSGTSNTQGGAIIVFPDGAKATITNSRFTANSANVGGAVSFAGVDQDSLIESCTFTDNTASDGGAIYLWTGDDAAVTVKDSTFSGNTAGWGNAISTDGALKLEGNTISTTSADIGNWGGSIDSEVCSIILANDTYSWHMDDFVINATLTDDNGNMINDHLFNFVISKEGAEDILVPATFYTSLGYYQGVFTPTEAGDYIISIDYPVAEVQTSVLKLSRSLIDLANIIANDDDGIIELDGDYAYIAEFDESIINGISIDKAITINGNNYVISGSDSARLFTITSTGDLTLNSVTIANGKADDGAGVYAVSGAKLTATGTAFKDSTATYSGGAIYADGTEISLDSCVLDGNDVTDVSTNNNTGGAAIFANNSATIALINTDVTNNGRRELDRTNNDLINAVITLLNSSAVITGGLFENNTGIYGGAIMASGNNETALIISGSTFTNNKAYDGGAIYISDMETSISGSTFTNNLVVGPGSPGYYAAGGAIVADGGGSFALSDSIFTGNKATGEGAWAGAIGLGLANDNSAYISGCTFTDNTATAMGDSIYNHGFIALSGNTMDTIIENNGKINSEIIIEISGNTTYEVEAFDDFTVEIKVTDDNGNIIRVEGDKIGVVAYCYAIAGNTPKAVFDEATGLYKSTFQVSKSGVINMGNLAVTFPYADKNNVIVKSAYVTATPVNRVLEVTFDDVAYPDDVTFNVKVTREKDDTLLGYATVKITVNGETKSVSTRNGVGTITFTGLEANTYEVTATIAASAVYNANEETYILHVFEKQGTYKDLQQRIAAAENGILELPYDITYDADYDGEALIEGIFISNDLTINGNDFKICGNELARVFKVTDGATLTLNDVTICDGVAEKGAGVYIDAGATLNANNVTFIDNVAVKRGGAIYSEGTVNVDTAVFDKNDITFRSQNDDNGGAAIYNNGGTLVVNNANITNNLLDIVIRDGNDGHLVNAVVFTNGDTTITDSYFANNTGSWGAGIYVTGDATLTVKNTTFEGNNATFGASIYDEGAKIIVDNCTFNDNKGLGIGSAGTSSTQAGAILVMSEGASATITDSKFNRNSAKVGGAVSISQADGDVLIEGCEFTENTASNEGGAIYNYAADGAALTVKDSIFTDNTATNWGDAISNDAGLILEGNTITGGRDAAIGNWLGTIDSKVCSIVLANDTYNWHMDDFVINATLTDDNGNLINDHFFNFVISKEGSDDILVPATFYTSLGYYQGVFTPAETGDYIISIDYPVAEVQTSILKLSRSLTDLANIIANDDDGIIDLDGDYSYIAEFDESIIDGIVIDKAVTINGNDYAIDGSGLARLFDITSGTLTLNDLTLANAKADKGAAVYVDAGATLNANNVNFTENTATYRGGAIYSEGTVNIDTAVFDSNDITFRTRNDDNGGAAIYNLNGVLNVNNANITNNLKDIVIRNGNAGDLLVGAVVTSGETTITDSYFANNTGSWGGAISSLGYMNENPYTLTVTGTTFEGNNATFGGAIFVESSNLVVDDCTFTENKGVGVGSSGTSNTQGGAIIVFPDGAKATITNSRFTANSANVGGAVSFAGVDQDSLIEGCTFTDNTASDGGAIYLWTGDDAAVTVKDSTFSGNTAGWGNAISTDGALKLEGNTISTTSADIGNWGGSIESTIYAILIDGQEIEAALGSEVTPTAKLTDDNGNIIRDRTFKITVNGEELETSFADGVYTAAYTIETAGDNVVSTSYVGAVITEGKYVVEKENAKLTVTVEDIIDGEAATISVTLTGINDSPLSADVKVIINNTEYIIAVSEGTGSKTIEGLEHGSYPVVAILDESTNYNTAIDSIVFYVKASTVLTIDEIGDVEYGEPVTVTVHLTDKDGNGLTGTVVISEDTVLVENGVGTLSLAPDVGEYELTAEFAGTNDYNASVSEKVSFTVNAKDINGEVSVSAENSAAGAVTVTITAPAEGTYNVTVGDQTVQVPVVYDEETDSFRGETTITGLTAGDNTATVVIDDDNYDLDPITVSVVPKKGTYTDLQYQINKSGETLDLEYDFAYDAAYDGTKYPDGVLITNKNITINGNGHTISGEDTYRIFSVSGSNVVINDVVFANGKAANGGAITTTSNLTIAGSKFINNVATGNGGAIYATVSTIDAVLVDVSDSEFNDNSANNGGALYVNTMRVSLKANNVQFNDNSANNGGAIRFNTATGSIENSIFKDNKATSNGGAIYTTASVNISDSSFIDNEGIALNNQIYQSLAGRVNMTGTTISSTTPAIDAETSYAYGSHVLVTGTFDAGIFNRNITMKYTLDGVEGTALVSTVGTNKANFTIDLGDDLTVGTHTITIQTFTDDSGNTFVADTVTASFEVTKAAPILEVEGDNLLMPGDTATVGITLTGTLKEGIEGIVIVTVDGKDYLVYTDANGEGSVDIAGLISNKYPITAKFIGNDDYATVTNDTEFIDFYYRDAVFDIVIEDVTYGDVINIIVENATDLEGNPLSGIVMGNIENAEGTGAGLVVYVEEGSGTATVRKLDAGDYNVVATFYDDDYEYISETKEFTFNVAKAESALDVTYADGEFTIALDGINGEKLNESVAVMIDGVAVEAKVTENGTITFAVADLAVGRHTIEVAFAGNGNYLGDTDSYSFEIPKPAPALEVEGASITYGATATVGISLTNAGGDGIEGIVIVTVDGKDYVVYTDANGEGSVDIAGLIVKEYPVVAKFVGNDNYLSKETTAAIVVKQASTIVTITAPGEITYGDALNVVTELTSGGNVIAGDVVIIVKDAEGNVVEDLTKLPKGTYTINATFAGNDNYQGAEDTATVVVKQASTIVTITAPGEITYGDALTIGTELTSGGQVISGVVDVVVTDKDGNVVSDLSKLNAGEYTITAAFAEDDNYLGDDATATVVVKQADSSVAVIPIAEINVGETQSITVTVGPEGVEGTVKVIVVGDGYSFSKEYSVSELADPITLTDLSAGAYSIDAIFNAGDNYELSTASATFTVKSSDVSAKVNATLINFGESVTVTIEGLPADIPASDLNITDNGKEIAVTLNGNEFVYAPAESGDHVIAINYNGTAYDKFSAEVGFTVAPEGEYIVIPANNSAEAVQEAINNAPAGATIKLADDTTYDLAGIELNNNVTIAGGEGTVITVPAGQSSAFVAAANASAVSIKNVKFVATSDNQSLLSVSPNDLGGGISQVPAITIENVTAIPAAGVNESTISLLNANTKANPFKPSSDVAISKNIIASGVSSLKTNATAMSGNVALKKAVKTTLTGANTQKVYAIPYKAAKSGKYYSVTLKDANGNVLAGKNVKFTLAGKTYTVKTNAKGVAKLAINIYKPGTYKLAVSFAGESTLGASSKQATIKILKNKVKITRKTKKVKRSNKKRTLKYYVKTKTGKKMGIKGVKVYLKINKKTYKAKTNKKGLVKFKVKLPRIKKTYKVKVIFKGNKANKKRTLKTKVKVY